MPTRARLASSKSGAVTNINTQIRDVGHDAQFALNASGDVLHIENFVQAVTGSSTYQLRQRRRHETSSRPSSMRGSELRPVHLGNTPLNISRQLKCKAPGLIEAPIGGGGTGEPALNWIGGDLAAGEFILEVCGATPGTDPARIQQLSVAINGNGKRVGGLYLNFVTFSDPTKIRVVNCKGGGVKTRKMHDDLVGDVSIENCGWSSLGNKDVTGVDDGLALEEYAWDRDGAGGDTSNESHVLRLQVEKSRFLAIRDVGQLANVTCNIHSERTMFATPGGNSTPGTPLYDVAGFTRWAWFFTGARSEYNQGRFTAINSKNLALDSERVAAGANWASIGAPTLTAKVSVAGDAILDRINDTSAGVLQGRSQTIPFTGNGTKAFSVYVAQDSSPSSVFHLLDTTAANGRLAFVLTWALGVPVITLIAGLGTYLGYAPGPNNTFRLLFSTTAGVIAANNNSFRIYPATDAAFSTTLTGALLVGGVMFEDAATPGEYAKTGATSVPADQNAILFGAGETMTYNDFSTEGEVTVQSFGSAGSTVVFNNPNFNGRFRNDFGGGGGPVKVVKGKCTLVKTGIDPAIEDALTFEGTQIATLSVGDCGNPGLGRRFKLFGGRVGLLTSDSANSGIEAFGTVFDNIRDGCEYQSIFHNCTVLASTGGGSSGTWLGRGYVEIDGGLIVPPFTMGNGLTLNAYGAVHGLGLWTQATVASALPPGLRLAGGISGFGIPTANPDVHAQWATAWKRAQIHWNYAWTGTSDPLFWEFTTAWVPVYIGSATPVEAPTPSTVPLRTAGGDLRGVGMVSETGALTGIFYFGSTHNAFLQWDGTNFALVGNGVQVLGGQRHGWTASTGTPTRTGFATSTATVTQVAEALKALIDDLLAHGLIGA
jgi:hypothetical protein